MLVQQYRCHEHIMNVFNHFYRNELKLGWAGQNNAKQHNVKLFSNGRNIIEPSKHIYFIDCKGNETHEADSTSMYNSGEAKVVAELLRKLNTYFKENPSGCSGAPWFWPQSGHCGKGGTGIPSHNFINNSNITYSGIHGI